MPCATDDDDDPITCSLCLSYLLTHPRFTYEVVLTRTFGEGLPKGSHSFAHRLEDLCPVGATLDTEIPPSLSI